MLCCGTPAVPFLLFLWLTSAAAVTAAEDDDNRTITTNFGGDHFNLLTEQVMQITLTSARLSNLAYTDARAYEAGFDEERNITLHEHPDYDQIQFYTEEPDQALLARSGGRCYIAFRYVLRCGKYQ